MNGVRSTLSNGDDGLPGGEGMNRATWDGSGFIGHSFACYCHSLKRTRNTPLSIYFAMSISLSQPLIGTLFGSHRSEGVEGFYQHEGSRFGFTCWL